MLYLIDFSEMPIFRLVSGVGKWAYLGTRQSLAEIISQEKERFKVISEKYTVCLFN